MPAADYPGTYDAKNFVGNTMGLAVPNEPITTMGPLSTVGGKRRKKHGGKMQKTHKTRKTQKNKKSKKTRKHYRK